MYVGKEKNSWEISKWKTYNMASDTVTDRILGVRKVCSRLRYDVS